MVKFGLQREGLQRKARPERARPNIINKKTRFLRAGFNFI